MVSIYFFVCSDLMTTEPAVGYIRMEFSLYFLFFWGNILCVFAEVPTVPISRSYHLISNSNALVNINISGQKQYLLCK